jgi:hypothetical protein
MSLHRSAHADRRWWSAWDHVLRNSANWVPHSMIWPKRLDEQ